MRPIDLSPGIVLELKRWKLANSGQDERQRLERCLNSFIGGLARYEGTGLPLTIDALSDLR